MRIGALGVALQCSLYAVHCGSSNEDTRSAQYPAQVETLLSAESGGTVLGGGASLLIPVGALRADTTISLKTSLPADTLPERGTIQGQIYEFGPEGTHFQKPAILSLSLPGAADPSGRYVVSWLDRASNSWMNLATTLSGTTLTAPIGHFSSFAIRFWRVTNVDCSFSACGGDPTGQWTVVGACGNLTENSGIQSTCATAILDTFTDVTGVVVVSGDHSYTSRMSTSGRLVMTLPPDCTAKLKLPSCGQLSGTGATTTCTGTPDEGCTCTLPITGSSSSVTGTWSTHANVLRTTSSEDSSVLEQEFCVSAGTLKVKTEDGLVLVFSN